MARFCPFVLILSIVAIITIEGALTSPLDCRRFVFAPACRGATIKRSFTPKKYLGEMTNLKRQSSQCNDNSQVVDDDQTLSARLPAAELSQNGHKYLELIAALKEPLDSHWPLGTAKSTNLEAMSRARSDYSGEEPEQTY